MLTRDSWLLFLGIIGGFVIYLSNTPTKFWAWDYYAWLAFLGYAISVISAWLSSSQLAASTTSTRDSTLVLGGLLKLTAKEK